MMMRPKPDGRRIGKPGKMQNPAIHADQEVRALHQFVQPHQIECLPVVGQMPNPAVREPGNPIIPIEQDKAAVCAIQKLLVKGSGQVLGIVLGFRPRIPLGVQEDHGPRQTR